MTTLLTYDGDSVDLSELVWEDEMAWSGGVRQTVERSVTGALLIQIAQATGGRPVTLSASDDAGWLTRSAVQMLKAWEAMPGIVMQLQIGGVSRSVMWRIEDERTAVEARPLIEFGAAEVADDDRYVCTLKLMEV